MGEDENLAIIQACCVPVLQQYSGDLGGTCWWFSHNLGDSPLTSLTVGPLRVDAELYAEFQDHGFELARVKELLRGVKELGRTAIFANIYDPAAEEISVVFISFLPAEQKK